MNIRGCRVVDPVSGRRGVVIGPASSDGLTVSIRWDDGDVETVEVAGSHLKVAVALAQIGLAS